MEIRQLRYFVAVAEELSFTGAAQRLFAAQSTVSAAVRALEDDLEVTLFDRSTRRVALSPAGLAFLTEARRVVAAAERARAVAGEASTGLRGSIRIGTLTAITALDLPRLVGAFRTTHPMVDVHVRVSGSGSAGIADDLRRGRLDVGVVALEAADAPGLDLRPFMSLAYVVLVPDGHRLAGNDDISLADLAAEDFVEYTAGFSSRLALDRAYAEMGVERRIRVEIGDTRMAAPYVREIRAVAVMPDLTVPEDAGVLVKPLRSGMRPLTLSFAVPAGRDPGRTVSALLELSGDFVQPDAKF
jgi:DNA-binding transcriptional LysR family regulator